MTVSFDYSEKTVLVTGGTRGIGLNVAQAFKEAGATVHITGTRAEANDYEDDLSGLVYHQCRQTEDDDRARLADAIESLDVLINNAGAPGENEYETAGVEFVMDVNLISVADLCYRFKDKLTATKGAIINVSSVGGVVGMRDFPAYSASKHGLIGFSKSLADKWARFGIRVNVLAPGFIKTRMTDWVRADERVEKSSLAMIPQARFGSPEDLAPAMMFLASPQAGYICGHTLVVDGGFTLR